MGYVAISGCGDPCNDETIRKCWLYTTFWREHVLSIASHCCVGPSAATSSDRQQPSPPAGPQTSEDWIDALVQEMSVARDLADARGRASKVLHAFEQAVAVRARAQVLFNSMHRSAAVCPSA